MIVNQDAVNALRSLAVVTADLVADGLMPSAMRIVQLVAAIATEADPWSAVDERRELAKHLDCVGDVHRKVERALIGAALPLRSSAPNDQVPTSPEVLRADIGDALRAIDGLRLADGAGVLDRCLSLLAASNDPFSEEAVRRDLTDVVRRIQAAGDVLAMMIDDNCISLDPISHRQRPSRRERSPACRK